MFISIVLGIIYLFTIASLTYLNLELFGWLYGKLVKKYPSLKKFSISRLTNRRSKKKEYQITPITVTCHIMKYPCNEKTGEPGNAFCGKLILTTKPSVVLTPIIEGHYAYREIKINTHIELVKKEHPILINDVIPCEKCEEEYNYFAQRKRFELRLD